MRYGRYAGQQWTTMRIRIRREIVHSAFSPEQIDLNTRAIATRYPTMHTPHEFQLCRPIQAAIRSQAHRHNTIQIKFSFNTNYDCPHTIR